MRRIVDTWREPYQHVDAVVLAIDRQQPCRKCRAQHRPIPAPTMAVAPSPPVPHPSLVRCGPRGAPITIPMAVTSVRHDVNESTIQHSVSSSYLQFGHEARCASIADTSLEGSARGIQGNRIGVAFIFVFILVRCRTHGSLSCLAKAVRIFARPYRIRVFNDREPILLVGREPHLDPSRYRPRQGAILAA